ncbi:unnamed protein product, partial [Mesorhabditis spiculigera]
MLSHLNCTRCELCESADAILGNDRVVRGLLLIQLFFVPLAILITALKILSIVLAKGLHIHQRLLLIAFASAVLVANIGAFLSCIYQLYTGHFIEEDDRCDWQIFRAESSLGLKYVYIIGLLGMALGPIILVTERIVACVRLENYRRNYALLAGVLAIYILLSTGWLFLDLTSSEQIFPYAAVELYAGQLCLDAVEFLFGTNALATFLVLFLWVFNNSRMLNTPTRALAEAKNASKALLPTALIVLLITFSSLLVLKNCLPLYDDETYIDRKVLHDVEAYAAWAEFQVTILPIGTCLLWALFLYIFEPVSQSFCRITGFSMCLGADHSRLNTSNFTADPSNLSFSFDASSNSSKMHIESLSTSRSNSS